MRRWWISVFLIGIGGAAMTQPAHSATYIVDQHDGSGADFPTIQAVLDADLKPGDRVVVKAGVYHERLTVKYSGAPGKPITIEGERGPKGEWLTIIDGSEPVPTDGWELAPEFTPNHGVYRRPWPAAEPFCMVLVKGGTTYDLAEFAWRGGQHDAFKHINLPADQLAWGFSSEEGGPTDAKGLDGQPVKYWDGIEAGYHYRDGYLYLRFRDGDHPSARALAWCPGGDLDGYQPHATVGAGVLLRDQSYVTVRNLHIRASQHGVMIQGKGAHHNVVDSCFIVNGQQKVLLEDKCAFNRVENCVLTERNLGSDRWQRGPWGGGWTYAHGVSANYYYRYKQEIGSSTDDPRDAGGIKLLDFGPGNVVAHNEIYNVNCGVVVSEWAGPDLRVFGNHFHDIDKGVMAWPTPDYAVDPNRTDVQYGIPDLQVYGNLFTTFFMALRPAGEADRFARIIYFYRNRLWTEPGVEGRAWYIWDEGEAGPHRYFVYNNSFAGGQDIATHRAENCRYVNNIISSSAGLILRQGRLPKLFDYNWCGGVSQPGEHWPESGLIPWAALNQPPHDHNLVHEGEKYWPDSTSPDFLLVKQGAQAEAVGRALDLTTQRIDGRLLPGFAPDAFADRPPDMGAVPFGSELPLAGTLGVPLDRSGWVARASHHGEAAALALDDDADTRWSSDARHAWLAVDMRQARTFSRVALDAVGSRADYPRAYEVYVSQDGHTWGQPVACGRGADTVTVISFPEQRARYLKVARTDGGTQVWSVHELRVYRAQGDAPWMPARKR